MKILLFIPFFILASGVHSQDTTLICMREGLEVASLETFNTKSLEFSPVYYGDGLVFVVARERNNILDRKTGLAYFDLMYSDVAPDGSLNKPVHFSPTIRTQFHEGPTTFNRDENEIFFTRTSESVSSGDKRNKKQHLKIYRGTKGAEDWEDIQALPFTSDEYSTAHPALSADGNRLVFASDMAGGYGGMDLYVVERKSGEWQTPVNLGPAVNSKGNDVFPFWHEGGYLFFSSDGHEGLGGLDVYVTTWTDQQIFKGLQHLAFPYNSGRDDLGFIVSADGRSGYIASDRKPTKGKDDLYRWSSPESIFCSPAVYQPLLTQREILITNDDGQAVSNAYIWMIMMSDEGPSMHREHFNTELVPDEDVPGSFYLRWGVIDTLSVETADAISANDGRAIFKIDETATYVVVVQHNEYLPLVQTIEGKNLPAYLRLSKAPEASVNCYNTLFTIYNESGDKRLEGADIYLSGRCLKNAIHLTANADGNAAGCLPAGCAVKAEITHEGFASTAFTFSPSEDDKHWPVYLKGVDDVTAITSSISSGTVIILDNIYYDFNKSAIRKSDAGELAALANILKLYRDLTIELTSHTDTRGSDEYNMELSWKRSESSKNYLVLLGVDGSRIITKAAGESMPRNRCIDGVECSEAEHQFNRRTEVRIINPAQDMEIRYKAND